MHVSLTEEQTVMLAMTAITSGAQLVQLRTELQGSHVLTHARDFNSRKTEMSQRFEKE